VQALCKSRIISAGGVNPKICSGSPIFNEVEGSPQAQFIICLSPSAPTWRGEFPDDWRYFVLPVEIAESGFRINVDAYFNGFKKNGEPRSKQGSCQDFVGPGPLRSSSIPDHQDDFLPYEEAFDLLGC